MAVQAYQVLLHYLLSWNIHLFRDRCFCEEVVIRRWQRLIRGPETGTSRTWKCYFFGASFFWFNWACNRLSNGLKQNKSGVIECYKEISSGHWQMAWVLYISLILPFFSIALTQAYGLHLARVFSHEHSGKHSLQGHPSSAISLKCGDFSHRPNPLNERNLPSWNALSIALKTEMAPISLASAEQNPPISSSFSWLRADRRRRMAVYEGKYLLLNFFRCCSRQRHISSAFWGQKHSCWLLLTVTKPRCPSPFYVIANTRPNPPITRTWTKMAAILAQFFKLWKFLKNRRFEQIQKFFHYCTTKIANNYSLIKTKMGLGAL